MIITDITSAYLKHILGGDDLAQYEQVLPELFDHYFTYWASRDYWHKELDEQQVGDRKNLILGRLPTIELNLEKHGFDTSNLEIVLMVGQGTTNGHAFKKGDFFAVFLPVEGYETEVEVDVFVTHEIIHALHYTAQPDFYFSRRDEKENTLRELMTEGLATYLTKEIMEISDEEALWADFLSGDDLSRWMETCHSEKEALFREVFELIEKGASQPNLFYASDPNDIRQYRAGYFIGLEVIKAIVAQYSYSPQDIFTITRENFETMTSKIASMV